MLKWILGAIVASLLWTALAGYALLEGWTRAPIAEAGDTTGFLQAMREYIAAEPNGNIALVLIEQGEEAGGVYRGPVRYDTLFPLASASKWIAALGVISLVDDGVLDLDQPVNDYLKRWQLPTGTFDSRDVTARRLLSHTAGLTDGLGFGDYEQSEAVPDIVASLNDPRASSGESRTIAVSVQPGDEFAYSGGGYLVLQLLVEDVTGKSFEEYIQARLFSPLGLARTTYSPLFNHQNIAPAETDDGVSAPVYQYASSAATGLSSTPADLTRLVRAMIQDRLPVNPQTFRSMRQPEARLAGQPIWGLGTILYTPTDNNTWVFGHAGQNEPAINSDIRINPDNGDAIIVLSTGNSSIATRIGFHWTLWQTGRPDFFGLPQEAQRLMPFYLAGLALVILVCAAGAWTSRARTGRHTG